MKINIDFGHPYFDEKAIFEITPTSLNDFYADENEINRLNLFFMLEASLHRFQNGKNIKAAAHCAFLMAYYLFIPLTPPASCELAEFYIDKALEWKHQNIVNGKRSLMGKINQFWFIAQWYLYLYKNFTSKTSFVYKIKCTCHCKRFEVYQDAHPRIFAKCCNCGNMITVYDLKFYPAATKLNKQFTISKVDERLVQVYVNYEYDDELKKILDDETACEAERGQTAE